MSGEATATRKGAKKQPTDWRGAPAEYSLYAPVPHKAEDYFSLLSPTQEKVVRYLMKVGTRNENDVWVCGQHSYADIARATRLHWTTVRRAVLSLIEKKSLERREVWSHGKKGGRRVATAYEIPAFKDVLERRRAIPGAAVTPEGHLLYIGRDKRIMMLEAAKLWAIDLAKVPNERAQQRAARAMRPPVAQQPAVEAKATEQAEATAAPATGPPEEVKEVDYPKVIKDAFKNCVSQAHFGKGTAIELIRKARQQAAARGEPISDREIADAIYAGRDGARGGIVQTIAFYRTALPEKVGAILDARIDARNELIANGGVCPKCNGDGLVRVYHRGVGTVERCECQREGARAAG
jgi:hypothetical protein